MSKFFVFLCFATVLFQVALSQCLNRPNIFNRQPEAIVEQIINPPLTFQPIIETPNLLPVIPTPGPTTIITDCTPSVCQNLVNTLQLMIVCNLLKNTKGGPEFAAQIASPYLSEVFSSPSYPCSCPERFFNLPNSLIAGLSPQLFPGVIGTANILPGMAMTPNFGVSNVNPNFMTSFVGM